MLGRILVLPSLGGRSGPGRLQHLADVVERCRWSDVAAQDGDVLVTGDVRDLSRRPPRRARSRRVASARRALGAAQRGGGAVRARLLTISATDWSVRGSWPTVSPRRIRRNTGPLWMFAACSHWLSARTAQRSVSRA